jgi:DNA repair protein SbcD/Mre11
MRLLHTSDWHLGQTLHNHDRTWEHQRFLDWLLNTLAEQDIDALLISGDVYDNANPSAATQRMLYGFLMAARQRVPHLNIVLIAGNHDSPGRLEAPAPFLEGFDARVVGVVKRDAEGNIKIAEMMVPLRNRAGEIAAWCLAIPFLRISDVPRLDSQGDAYLQGIGALYQQAQTQVRAHRQADQALIAMGHCHMAGGQVSEHSERRIVIGGAEMLSSSVFDADIAYAALGHLHLAQKVGGTEHIRYCGSPLPLSFAEVDYPHQVLKVVLDGARLASVESIRVPRAVALLRVPREPAPIEAVEAALAALDLPECEDVARPYLEVRVLLEGPEPGLRARIEAALEGKPVRLARIETRTASRSAALTDPLRTLDELGQLDPVAIFRDVFQRKYGEAAPDLLLSALNEILNLPDAVTE